MILWHRLFGIMLTDLFTYSPFDVELEKDLSLKQQFLDLVILRRRPGEITEALPDGFEDLAEHNLLTYKSLREPLDAWAINELIGHLVNYRKQVSPSMGNLIPLQQFRLFGISTRFPDNLRNEVQLEKRQAGVYELVGGTQRITVLVLSEMPDEPQNAVWGMFSAVPAKVVASAEQFRPHSDDGSTILNQLFERYQLEGVNMPYTLTDFQRDYTLDHLDRLTPEERLRGLPPEERLRGLGPEERLRGLPPEERLRGLGPEERLRGLGPEERLRGLGPEERLRGLPPEERLRGLSVEEMEELEAFLHKLKRSDDQSPED